jgi:putative ABC transport system substrate-binding protein
MPTPVHPRGETHLGRLLFVVVVTFFMLFCGCTPAPKVYRVGILVSTESMAPIVDSFKARMTELGYREGATIVYDVQRSKADPAEEKRISRKFVADKVDLVFVFPGQPALTVKAAARGTGIPVVFANAVLEGSDLVDSFRLPGGNITGVRIPSPDLAVASLKSLLEINPRAKRIMVIFDPAYPTNPVVLETVRRAAAASHIELQEVRVLRASETQAALQGLEKSGDTGMNAILLFPDLITRSSAATRAIIAFADRHRVPVVGGPTTLAHTGAMLTVSVDQREQGTLAAFLVDKIFKGTPAGAIPLVSTQPHLFINYAKARKLGLPVPEGLLKRASEIIR